MNPKTVGIFAGATLLSAVAAFLVVRGPISTPPTVPPPPPPPPIPHVVGQPQPSAQFGNLVQAHAVLSQSHLVAASSSDLFLNVELSAANRGGSRAPFAAALVIDRSGSMAGVKIDNARDAALAFLKRLRDDDQIAVISYGSDVSTDVSLARVGEVRGLAQRRIMGIDSGGGTNIAGGLRAAIRQLAAVEGPRRVLLISDGRPTEGERNPTRLAAIAGQGRGQGLAFSTIGVGLDYDENVMERIALSGGGAFHHLRQASALASILTREFQAVETLVAAGVRLRIDPGPGVTVREVYGYQLSREGQATLIDVGDLSAGEQRRLVARATVQSGGAAVHSFATLGLSYQLPARGTGESASASLSYAATADHALAMGSQNADVVVAANKVEAAAAVRESMEAMSNRDRSQAMAKLRQARARINQAAAEAPAAAAPALKAQAAEFDALEAKAGAVDFESEAGRDFVKSKRAASFADQRR